MDSPTIVFDIGNVLVSFSLDPFHQFFAQHAKEIPSPQTIQEVTAAARRYELGKSDCEEFTSYVAKYLRNSPGHQAIAKAWCSIFTPNPKMIELAKSLSQRHSIAILSNTNELHWQFLDSNFGLSSFASTVVLSHRVGSLKPDLGIYQALEEQLDIEASDIIFLDDKEENVEAAVKRGWKAFQHNEESKTLSILKSLRLLN